jgi:hypothetical protein
VTLEIGIVKQPHLLGQLCGPWAVVQAGQQAQIAIQLLHVLHKLPDGHPVGLFEAITYVIPLCLGRILAEHH